MPWLRLWTFQCSLYAPGVRRTHPAASGMPKLWSADDHLREGIWISWRVFLVRRSSNEHLTVSRFAENRSHNHRISWRTLLWRRECRNWEGIWMSRRIFPRSSRNWRIFLDLGAFFSDKLFVQDISGAFFLTIQCIGVYFLSRARFTKETHE